MVLVLFEVTVKKGCVETYRSLAAELKDELARTGGFIRLERFASLTDEGKLLSLSVWENEQAVEKWRNNMRHRMSQRQGRDTLFERYAITIASTIRSYTQADRAEAPQDSNEFFI